MDAVTYVYYTANTTNVLNNINFIHNTFVDCGMIDFGGTGATNGTWANNIFKKTGTIFQNANAGTTFKGNIYSGTLGVTIPAGMTNIDPKLALNSEGYYGLTASSPAINAANATYPSILDITNIDDDPTLLLDIKGLPRPASAILKDVGCEEYNASGTIVNRPLKLADVGPTFLKPTTTLINPTSNEFDFDIRVNNTSKKLQFEINLDYSDDIYVDFYNSKGQLCKAYKFNYIHQNIKQGFSVNIDGLKSGMYILTLHSNNFSKSKKVILSH
jgi:hypothetical protein